MRQRWGYNTGLPLFFAIYTFHTSSNRSWFIDLRCKSKNQVAGTYNSIHSSVDRLLLLQLLFIRLEIGGPTTIMRKPLGSFLTAIGLGSR